MFFFSNFDNTNENVIPSGGRDQAGILLYGRWLSGIQPVEGWETLLLLCTYPQISSGSDPERS